MSRTALLVPLVVACLTVGPAVPRAASAEARAIVAVLPMIVNASEDRAYLRDGLSDMLTSRLGRQAGIGVVRVEDAAAATVEASSAREAGRAVGANFVVFGSFTRFGEGASLDLRCVRVEDGGGGGDPRSVFIQAAEVGQIIPGLDGVAVRIAEYVRGAGSAPSAEEASAPAPAPVPAVAGGSDVEALRRRVEALEQSVYGAGSAPGGAAP